MRILEGCEEVGDVTQAGTGVGMRRTMGKDLVAMRGGREMRHRLRQELG